MSISLSETDKQILRLIGRYKSATTCAETVERELNIPREQASALLHDLYRAGYLLCPKGRARSWNGSYSIYSLSDKGREFVLFAGLESMLAEAASGSED